jgi:hypothetical protein
MRGTRKYAVAQPYDAPRVRLRMSRRMAAKILGLSSGFVGIHRTHSMEPCRSSLFHLCLTSASSPWGSGTYLSDQSDTGRLYRQQSAHVYNRLFYAHDSSGDPEIPPPSTHLSSIRNQFYQSSNLNPERRSQCSTE